MTPLSSSLLLERKCATSCQPLRYPGQYADGGEHLYAYCRNPVGWHDPLGWADDPANATHITYVGVKDGKPYVGYASKPGLGHTADDVLRYVGAGWADVCHLIPFEFV